eukprot:tig00021290_g19982.t1
MSIRNVFVNMNVQPFVAALASIPGLAVDLEAEPYNREKLIHAVNLVGDLRPLLRRCTIHASEESGVLALAALPAWPGLTIQTKLRQVPAAERPALLRALAGALKDAGNLTLFALVSSEADIARLTVLAPLGPRLRLWVYICTDVEGLVVEVELEDQKRLERTALALLRGCFAASQWSLLFWTDLDDATH